MIDRTHMDPRLIDGGVDFTMMYAAHDAFTRHLDKLVAAVEQGHAADPRATARWELFKKQLHVHHTSEDTALWPRLRAAVSGGDEEAVIDAMEREHEQLDPLLSSADEAFTAGDSNAVMGRLRALNASLTAHMRHEEAEALPLVAEHLGPAGWAAFTQDIRKAQGMRAGAVYLPWLLEGAPPKTSVQVLAVLPPPVRFLCRRIWMPRYRRSV